MNDTETASWIAALERARTELERALSADEHWRALRGAVVQSDRAGHERVLAGNPVYCCWERLNQTIEELRREAQAEATAARRRVSLRDVLEHIRSDAGLQAPQFAPAGTDRKEAAQPTPTDPASMQSAVPVGDAPPEAAEATVSFVIREPARPAAVAGHGGKSPLPREPAPPEAPDAETGGEAEVVIVPRRR